VSNPPPPPSSDQAAHAGPAQDIATQGLAQDAAAEPDFAPGARAALFSVHPAIAVSCKIFVRLALGQDEVDQQRHGEAAQDIVEEAVGRLEAQDPRADAEHERGDGADVGERLAGKRRGKKRISLRG